MLDRRTFLQSAVNTGAIAAAAICLVRQLSNLSVERGNVTR